MAEEKDDDTDVMVILMMAFIIMMTVVVIVMIRSNVDLLKRRTKLFLENAWWVTLDNQQC